VGAAVDRNERLELHELLSSLLDGSLTPAEQKRLGDQLRRHAAARDLYLAYFALHADLALRSDVERLTFSAAKPSIQQVPAPLASAAGRGPARSRRALRWATVGLAAAAAALILLILSRFQTMVTPPPLVESPAEPTHQSVAVLLRSPEAEWEDSGLPTQTGAPLPPGRLLLKSGFAQIEFYCGATVILEGPATFELVSSREAYCARGKLRATVPAQAQGFVVRSPRLDVVDLGTEFGLDVGDKDHTEVHVFQGKVDLYNAGAARQSAVPRELIAGQSVCVDAAGDARRIDSAPTAFRTALELDTLVKNESEQRQQRLSATRAALRRDPDVVVYYSFEPGQPWSRTLRDQASDKRQAHDGAIIGCSWGAGRWPGKDGLEFKRLGDRVRFRVPGEYQSLSLAAWVRVDALPNLHNSLMMTDGWEPGAPHWHIGANGSVRLGVQGRGRKGGANYVTAPIFTPDRLGQWVHLAVVYDRANRRVTHYVDGQSVFRDATRFDLPLCLGNAELGNWNAADLHDRQPIRNLSGCMDEFILYSRALTDEEVQELYTRGKGLTATP
jgi:hypothetical protein